jgi:hypothetical protein
LRIVAEDNPLELCLETDLELTGAPDVMNSRTTSVRISRSRSGKEETYEASVIGVPGTRRMPK